MQGRSSQPASWQVFSRDNSPTLAGSRQQGTHAVSLAFASVKCFALRGRQNVCPTCQSAGIHVGSYTPIRLPRAKPRKPAASTPRAPSSTAPARPCQRTAEVSAGSRQHDRQVDQRRPGRPGQLALAQPLDPSCIGRRNTPTRSEVIDVDFAVQVGVTGHGKSANAARREASSRTRYTHRTWPDASPNRRSPRKRSAGRHAVAG